MTTARRLAAQRTIRFAWLCATVACRSNATHVPDATPNATVPAEQRRATLVTLYEHGLTEGWRDEGTLVRDLKGGPARVEFTDTGTVSFLGPDPGAGAGGVVFRVKEPPGEGEFLQVGLVGHASAMPQIKIRPDDQVDVGGGWTEVFIPIQVLNPDRLPIDGVVFRSFRPIGNVWALLDDVSFAKADAKDVVALRSPSSVTTAGFRLSCDDNTTPISPAIYGIGGGWDVGLGASASRWGGNATSRYNWESNVENASQDWFFENRASGRYAEFLDAMNAGHALAALTVPILGWVAKDDTSYSFPVSVFGSQSKVDPAHPDIGNGLSPSGAKIRPGPPTRTSVPAPSDWVKRWVHEIVSNDVKAGRRSVYEYILDNEPALWNTTHRDVHPEPVGYDELLERTINYGTAIREADPNARIAGPAEWGWTNYFNSAKDATAGYRLALDRRAHGDVPLIEWYLSKLQEYERKNGIRVLDVLDVHYYPQADNVYGGGQGGTDDRTAALRLRSTRSLWDSTYVDESWIGQPVRLLPRMKEWVDKNYPNRGISIGEWNFGGENHITGALATAEALGRFAQFGVTSAFYWTYPRDGSPSRQGFLAYRNFDGKGGHFLEQYVPSTAPPGASLFVSRDVDGKHLVAVAINMSPDKAIAAQMDLASCGTPVSAKAYVYGRGASGFFAVPTASVASQFEQELPPWSITVLDIQLAQPIAPRR